MNKKKPSIGNSIFVYFTVTAVLAAVFISLAIYSRLSAQLESSIKEENVNLVNQVNISIDKYIRSIIRLSDSIYYGVIKNADISDSSVSQDIFLLYDNHKDMIQNIALFSASGDMLLSVPAARMEEGYELRKEAWFLESLSEAESIYFSKPHVQRIFVQNENAYKWVISMARAVEITANGKSEQALLLMDIDYSSVAHLVDNISFGSGSYIYLMDAGGELLYHPKLQLIYAGLESENNEAALAYADGLTDEYFQGVRRSVLTKSVGYTGWKIVGVSPNRGLALNTIKTKLFMVFVIACIIFMVSVINAYISYIITDPIKALEKSVNELEAGNMDAQIHIGGSYEIMHLGNSLKDMSARIKSLMQDIMVEGEEKRKSEFATLQSQINPHFLYNTLDIIVWMIENEKKSEAVRVVTALARFFRISLSKGKSIISVGNELEHVRNYLMIQQMRFKNKFDYEITVDEEILEYASLKLMLQPLVENSIYHGMEFMDGDGMIRISVERVGQELHFRIADNGLGMTREQADALLKQDRSVSSKKGSGIGVRNVNERIKLYFGEEYGLRIESEPDEGTCICLILPLRSMGEVNG